MTDVISQRAALSTALTLLLDLPPARIRYLAAAICQGRAVFSETVLELTGTAPADRLPRFWQWLEKGHFPPGWSRALALALRTNVTYVRAMGADDSVTLYVEHD